ncbi:hypothetical protein BamIOP4010DRAFT_3228 [Burkholderia ambifaria IOP40-10]|uniref:Uncharacterized protein n=1 Tax=Burkholderia ambifaria IOP40-10 TaxID=396596 RepID=B1FGR8_9BURK|nr:hypothetical protein BamIOP4010DRAFT_3228 [Burkholderia ambifaria IOP40-10]
MPASTALASVPSISVIVSEPSSCAPLPPPLSLYATAQPRLRPHSPAAEIAPYTPREPDDVAVTMHGCLGSKLAGTCTSSVTFLRPLPSSEYARYSVPGILPSPSVALPSRSTFGPQKRP